jgi:hypothetical protein
MKKLASIVLFFILSVAHAHGASYVYAPYATPPVYSHPYYSPPVYFHPYSGSPPIYGGRHGGYPANGWHHGGGDWQGGGPHGRQKLWTRDALKPWLIGWVLVRMI